MQKGLAPSAKPTSLARLSLALLMLAAPPGVEGSRTRRRHPVSAHADHSKPASLASAGLSREDSSIPGVSIWTSKTAAAERVGFAGDVLGRRKGGAGRGGHVGRSGTSGPAYSSASSQGGGWTGDDCQVICGSKYITFGWGGRRGGHRQRALKDRKHYMVPEVRHAQYTNNQ